MVVKKPEVQEDSWAEEPQVGPGNYLPRPDAVSDRDFLTVTLKAGTGYDAPWLVFHANSVEEALESLQHDQLDELMDLTARKGKELAKAFGGSQSAPKSSGGSSWGSKNKAKPKSSGGAVEETDDGYECEHGEAVFKEGKTNGRKWAGWFCPSRDRDDQCKPAFE